MITKEKLIKFPILYKRVSRGTIQTWQIFVRGNQYWTKAGMVKGTITKSKKTTVNGKSIGRSNETTPAEQALKDAQSKYDKKRKTGHKRSINRVDDPPKFVSPMLAHDFKKQKKPIAFPVHSQPKLDGIRCIASRKGLYSRAGERFVSCPHIEKQLTKFFDDHPNMVLDGELYNHDLKHDFNQITSLIKTTKPTAEHFAKTKELVQYHVYDVLGKNITGNDIAQERFPQRLRRLEDIGKYYRVKIVPTAFHTNKYSLDKQYKRYLKKGYEGQMIRLDGPYENKRTKYLLKRKEFVDAEFTVVRITEGKGKRAGMAGRFYVKDKKGIVSKANLRGNDTLYKEWFRKRKRLIGKIVTVRYQNLTPDGKLRFARVVCFRGRE